MNPTYTVNATCNYFFMAASTPVLAVTGTLVTEKVVEPRLGAYRGEQAEPVQGLTAAERRGLRAALVAGALVTVLLLAGTFPAAGFLRDSNTRDLLRSPFMSGIVAIIFL